MKLTKSLKSDLVKDLKPASALTVWCGQTIGQTIELMQQHRQGCVLVVDDQGQAQGIFTERDVLRGVIGEQISLDRPIKEVMSTDLATVRETDAVTRPMQLMHRRGLRHVPVLDRNHKPVGMVSIRRVLEYLVEHFPETVYNLPPNSSQALGTREGA